MAKFDEMVSHQKQKSGEKLSEIIKVAQDIKKSGAKFDTLTQYAKEISNRLKISSKQTVSSTSILRSGSPYRIFVQKAFAESSNSKSSSKSPQQEIVELEIALRMKNKEIDDLKSTVSKLLEKHRALQETYKDSITDKLEGKFSPHEPVFEFLKVILDYVSEPVGVYKFNKDTGELMEPISSRPILNKFPDGFLDWLKATRSKK